MTVKIGFVGSAGSPQFGDSLRQLLPAGATLEALSVDAAARGVISGELMVVIIPLDADAWSEMLTKLIAALGPGEQQAAALLGLVPRDDPAKLAAALDLRIGDVASLPIQPLELRARLAALVRRRQRAIVRAAENRSVWELALIDPVTGLHNRHHLDAVLPPAFASARSTGRPLSVLMIDLDALKPFNDRWGHTAGDRLLRVVAEALRGSLRPNDTIVRFGGDELVVVLRDTDMATARSLADQLVRTVARTPVGRSSDGPVQMTISVGLAGLSATDGDPEALLHRADAALYEAKRAGRNRVASA